MALTTANLVRVSNAPYAAGNPKSKYLYTTDDSVATVVASGYFNGSTNTLRKGDVIECICSISGTPSVVQVVVTSATGAATVTTAGANAAGLVDNLGGATGGPIAANLATSTIVLPVQLADLATGTFKVAVPYAFTVTSVLFRTAKPASTAAKLATLTVGINGTPVTGGVINLTTANQSTIGGTVAGSAITALNVGAAGNTLEAAASAVTAFVEGDGWVEFTVVNTELKNAISALNAA